MRILPAVLIAIAASTAYGQSAACVTELCKQAKSAHLEDLHWPDFSDYATAVEAAYSAAGGSPLWFKAGEASPQASALIQLLRDAAAQGLTPDDYDGSQWEKRLSSLKNASAEQRVKWDLALTVSAARYASDLHFGRVNPGLFHSKRDVAQESFRLPALLGQLASAPDVRAALRAIEPPFDGYQRTQEALQTYIRIASEPQILVPAAPAKNIDPGTRYEGVGTLAALLRKLGDLPRDGPEPAAGMYKGALVEAVKRFQSRHGLEADGRIGAATLRNLNTSPVQRVKQLELTLERWRWVPHSFARPPIVVNIPEFRLRGLNSSYRTEIEMKVVVGKAYGHETPIFASTLRNVVFHPYWNVPRSIVQKELIADIVKDRSYLAKNDYEVVTWDEKPVASGERVTDEILARLRTGKATVRQKPGAKNALGPVKFVFPNEHDVYMHGTPAGQLFSRTRRDFSHGCIRVEHPAELAEWVLRMESDGKQEWDLDRVKEAMDGNREPEPRQINLRAPIPVLIVYATAVALEGETRFFDDIYGQDEDLIAVLKKGPPYPAKKPERATKGARVSAK